VAAPVVPPLRRRITQPGINFDQFRSPSHNKSTTTSDSGLADQQLRRERTGEAALTVG
jgi:hypothetical protein